LKVRAPAQKKTARAGGVVLSPAKKSAGPARCGRTTWAGKSLPAGFGVGPGLVTGPNEPPDGVLAGPQDQKQKAKETEKLTAANTSTGGFNNGLIRRSARLPLPNYGPPTRAPVDSILWWLNRPTGF